MGKLLLLLFSCLPFLLQGQIVDTPPTSILVRFQENIDAEKFVHRSFTTARTNMDLQIERRVSKILNIYKLQFDPSIEAEEVIQALKKRREVLSVGYDTPVTYRNTTPNDELYERQWNLERINLPKVWDETTGGKTANGDEIVVAVLEKGITLDHPDIVGNLWRNSFEIENNEIDDDGNGYVDDYLGLNLEDGTDNHPRLNHGTQVAGIIGAKGNNNTGMAGINWDIKILFLSSVDLTSEAIEAYEYIYNLRKLYNETNGREGAFIVANNNSFGWDNTRPEDLQFGLELCEMYNIMGSVGILSVGAGPNRDADVEMVGDTPTNCASRFFIGVTSTNQQDNKSSDGGYGATSIDIGAPGEEIQAPDGRDRYCSCSGTSFAAPHVTGAIGLMYSIPCSQLATDAIDNASGTARFIKDVLLSGTDALNSLQSRTVSGGRLNVLNSLNNLQAYCGNNEGDQLTISEVFPIPASNQLTIAYATADFDPHQFYIANALGQIVREKTISPPRFATPMLIEDITGLASGVYFLTLQRGEDKVTRRFLVR